MDPLTLAVLVAAGVFLLAAIATTGAMAAVLYGVRLVLDLAGRRPAGRYAGARRERGAHR